jgi:hypothetical protein
MISNCTWSNVVSRNISPDIKLKLAEEDILLKKKEDIRNDILEKEWREMFVKEMKKKHGDFWYFIVEESEEDHETAQKLRTTTNKYKFENYLKTKYGSNWMYGCLYSNDDCYFVSEMRREEDREYYNSLDNERKNYLQWETAYKRETEEARSMEARYNSGEISLELFQQWKEMKDMEKWQKEEAYYADGLYLMS